MGMNLTFSDTNSSLSPTDDARLSRIESALPISRFGQVTTSTSVLAVPGAVGVLANGQISPTLGVANTGNAFQFVVQGQFGFVWNGSALTIYWDGTNGSAPFVIRRADGSQASIPKGSISISALAPTTSYSFAPFVSVAQPQRVSFVVGDSGSPRYGFSPTASADLLAMASQTQNLSSNEAITSGFIYFTTGAGGAQSTGGGTDSSGGVPYKNQPPNGPRTQQEQNPN